MNANDDVTSVQDVRTLFLLAVYAVSPSIAGWSGSWTLRNEERRLVFFFFFFFAPPPPRVIWWITRARRRGLTTRRNHNVRRYFDVWTTLAGVLFVKKTMCVSLDATIVYVMHFSPLRVCCNRKCDPRESRRSKNHCETHTSVMYTTVVSLNGLRGQVSFYFLLSVRLLFWKTDERRPKSAAPYIKYVKIRFSFADFAHSSY